MAKVAIDVYRPIYPTPAALITSISPGGKPNIITLGETFNISIRRPVIVGIAVGKARYSHELISQTREYVVNLPTARILTQLDQCGSVSGRRVDKFAATGLTALPAQVVKPPLIAECPINIECKVIGVHEVGDHDLFLGEVVAAHVDTDLLDETGKLCTDRLDTICFLHSFNCGAEYWSLGRKLADTWFTRRS
ncbi:MAG: flavin reductase family protein [Chloroflexi bacterium]|nr:flavin reductase family protein [Chloroflexota bacterium]